MGEKYNVEGFPRNM